MRLDNVVWPRVQFRSYLGSDDEVQQYESAGMVKESYGRNVGNRQRAKAPTIYPLVLVPCRQGRDRSILQVDPGILWFLRWRCSAPADPAVREIRRIVSCSSGVYGRQ